MIGLLLSFLGEGRAERTAGSRLLFFSGDGWFRRTAGWGAMVRVASTFQARIRVLCPNRSTGSAI
jgi:hypothetical protein